MIRPLWLLIIIVASVACSQERREDTLPVLGEPAFPMRGMSYVSWWKGQYSSEESDSSLANLRDTNTNYVALLVTWYMDARSSESIYPDENKTPSDEDVIHAIGCIHDLGMSVMLKPHVDVKDGSWRGEIMPSNTAAFFNSYSAFIGHYARMAQDNGVELFAVGTELKSLSGERFLPHWETVVRDIRIVYSGPLVYCSNWDEYQRVSFWSLLPYVGIDAYFPLSGSQTPSVEELMEGWSHWVAEIGHWQAEVGKPVIFTEIGYRSIDYPAKEPWVYGTPGSYNGQAQANCYEAAIRAFKGADWSFLGMFFWNWLTDPNAGAFGDRTDFTPQNKPAEDALRHWYASQE